MALEGERDYEPEWTEVLLSAYASSPLPWPPGVPEPPPVDPPKYGVVKHRVARGKVEPLRALLASLKARQAVLVHGKKWAVSLRPSLPGDAYLAQVRRAR